MLDSFYNKNFFNRDTIGYLCDTIEQEHFQIEENKNQAEDKKKTRTLLVHRNKIKHIIKDLESFIVWVNDRHFGYGLYPFNDHDICLYNIYDPHGEYGYHVDTSRSDVWDMKLTVLVNLSTEKFTGGQFMIYNGVEYEVPELSEPGSVLIIKSFLNHKVQPILSGQRKTLTLFGCGPKIK